MPLPRSSIRTVFAWGAAALLGITARPARADGPTRLADQHFTIDPVSDIILTGGGAGLTALLGLILSNNEIKPSPLTPEDKNSILGIDRVAVTQRLDPNADAFSTVGLWSAIGFAVLDPLLSARRDGWDAALVDAVMYAESLSLTEALTDITKIAVRRPRPLDYINCATTSSGIPSASCASTDLQLSFFSGHVATVASVTATATYLAFVRAPRTPRPWITLGVGTMLSAFVGYERVRSGEHFPTDVLAGALAGSVVGVLVPHLHRHPEDSMGVWVGLDTIPGGAALTLRMGL